MKILITGGAGFVGATLARTLLARGQLAGQALTALVLADQYAPPDDLLADPRVDALSICTPADVTTLPRVGPRELNLLTTSSLRPVVPFRLSEPTVMTLGSCPGELIVP